MFKRINNWHLSILVGIVSVFSLLLIQQYVEAQTWVGPNDLPGVTPDNTFVVNPLEDNIDLNGYGFTSANIDIDSAGPKVIDVKGSNTICLSGSGSQDCRSEWPTLSSAINGTAYVVPQFSGTGTVIDSRMAFDSTGSLLTYGCPGCGDTSQLLIQSYSYNGGNPFLTLKNGSNTTGSSANLLSVDDGRHGAGIKITKRSSSVMYGESNPALNPGAALYIKNQGTGYSIFADDSVNASKDTSPFVLDTDGQVGIATSTPTHSLEIRGEGVKSAEIALFSPNTFHNAGHWGIFHHHSDSDGTISYVVNGSDRDDLVLWHDGVNQARFTAQGKLYLRGNEICDINGANCWSGSGSGTNYWTQDASFNLSRPESNIFLLASTTSALPATASGAGARFIWYPNKTGAIRAGQLLAYTDYWDDANIGDASVAFGIDNKASGAGATVGGGYGNVASGVRATIAGGGGTAAINGNTASANIATIGGGTLNVASGFASTISGGDTNTASGYKSFIGGGYTNTASGQFSMILGGEYNKAEGDYSFAGGRGMQLTSAADNTFVWGEAPTSSPAIIAEPNQFLVFPKPPSYGPPSRFGFGTDYPLTYFHVNANDSSWPEPFVVSQDGKNTFFFIGIERWGENMGIDIGAYSNSDATYRNLTINRGAQGNVGIGVTEPTKRFMVQGDIEARGGVDLGVESINDSTYNYIQLDKLNSALPPGTECDEASEVGRMFWKDVTNRLIVCATGGWQSFQPL